MLLAEEQADSNSQMHAAVDERSVRTEETPQNTNEQGSKVLPMAPKTNSNEGITAKTDISPLTNWPMVLLSLFFIVGMIVLLGYVARRFSGFGGSAGQSMKILSTLQVGTRERVALIEVHGKQLVVGVTQHNINLLHSFDEAPPAAQLGVTEGSTSRSDFSQKLNALLSGKLSSDSQTVTKSGQTSSLKPERGDEL